MLFKFVLVYVLVSTLAVKKKDRKVSAELQMVMHFLTVSLICIFCFGCSELRTGTSPILTGAVA